MGRNSRFPPFGNSGDCAAGRDRRHLLHPGGGYCRRDQGEVSSHRSRKGDHPFWSLTQCTPRARQVSTRKSCDRGQIGPAGKLSHSFHVWLGFKPLALAKWRAFVSLVENKLAPPPPPMCLRIASSPIRGMGKQAQA